jgi:Catalytic LigB subunit of aromatic ring-opening dioxygenase
MARIVSVVCLSHSPYLYASAQEWSAAYVARSAHGAIGPSVPEDEPSENQRKCARISAAFAILRDQLQRAGPDVLLVVGDDQKEQFSFANFPTFAVFAAERFEGFRISPHIGLPVPGVQRPLRDKTPASWAAVAGQPNIARRLLHGLVDRGFDPAFSLSAPASQGLGHAFMRPLHSLTPHFDIPIIPIHVNCYFGPTPTAERCFHFGRALAEIAAGLDDDIRIGVIGSGGLWHTPLEKNAVIDPEFDAAIVRAVKEGDARAMAAYFDGRRPHVDMADAGQVERASGGTGVVGALGGGTGETRNWIVAAATVQGLPGCVVDYVPVHASPIGTAFAYWTPAA